MKLWFQASATKT